MDVSIIYVNYKTAQLIIDSICSVKQLTSGIEYEIIVVDNNSDDNSEELIHAVAPEVTYIRSKENIGFGRANNLAASLAKGDYIFFLNPDTILQNNAISVLVTYLTNNPTVGACGGNLVDEELSPANSFARFFPSYFEEVLNIFYLNRATWSASRSKNYNHTTSPLSVASIVGADLMIPRKVLDSVGWFDPDFFMNFEETELCFRIKKAGYAIISLPSAQIIHLEGKSSYISASRLERFFHGQYIFFFKRYGIRGAKRLNQIIQLKCTFRWWCFYMLKNKTKQDYWNTKREVNKKVYTQFIQNKA